MKIPTFILEISEVFELVPRLAPVLDGAAH